MSVEQIRLKVGGLHAGDVGRVLRLAADPCAVDGDLDPSSAELVLLGPGGQRSVLAASYADGTIEAILPDVLDVPGAWRAQGRLVTSSGGDWRTPARSFDVAERI